MLRQVVKSFVKRIVLSKVANVIIVLIFCITTAMNLIMDRDFDKCIVGLNVFLCLWILTYFRAKAREFSFDWFYAVLPLLYALLESIKKILQEPDVQQTVVHGALGFLIGLSIIVITYGCEVRIYSKQYDPTSANKSSIPRIPFVDAFFVIVVISIFVAGSVFLPVFP
ncbi:MULTISPECIES: hypothetical protein [Pantoea]|uniref:hypothetical protein n=1 Tax=Pantoea TaxID=53335 RepID=UPI001B3020C6|nr:hypothetical protein [Pantoea ananatis]